MTPTEVRRATAADAQTVAVLLDDFNREFDTPTPGPEVLARRLTELLEAACDLAQQRGAEVLEINVDGEDTDARRFYEAHGFSHTEPGASEPMYFYYRELG